MEMEILDNDKNQASNIRENDKEEDEENIYVLITDSYSHVVNMTRMC